MSKRRRLGIAGAVVGTASAGVAAAVAVKRYAVGQIRLRPDPEINEPLGELTGRVESVTTSDGVEIHVEVDGPEDAPLTVVFCHGYCLNLDSWHYQRRDLREDYRVVLWDHRCHGRSQRCDAADCTIDRLGADLHEILDKLVPGPCVLVGHSMGGMTIMALADAHPELFGKRVKGVALISTSAGRLAEVTIGLPAFLSKVVHTVMPSAVATLGRRQGLVDRGRRFGADLAFLTVRHLGFGDTKSVSPTLVDFVETMIRSTPMDVIADFYPTLMSHDKLAALDVLRDLPSAIIVGDSDWLTPPEHSKAMAEAVPGAAFYEVEETSHLPMLERPALVNSALRDLIRLAGPRKSKSKRSA